MLTPISNSLPTFFHNYFEDLIAVPIVLKTALLSVQLLRKSWRNFVFKRLEIICITALFSIYFEWILPYFNAAFTADHLDLICYGIGAWFYMLILNTPLQLRFGYGHFLTLDKD